ncbi:unnamed protein product [Pedinophyceae sp. YPF-701]|nr:unnamed protein product [Pedinophyceae sp. YPF-701]
MRRQPHGGPAAGDLGISTEPYPALLVLSCRKCLEVLGDSSSLVCTCKALHYICINVACNVVVDRSKLTVSRSGADAGATSYPCQCSVCKTHVGRVYESTPPQLSVLQGCFSLYTDKVKSYTVGAGVTATGEDAQVAVASPVAGGGGSEPGDALNERVAQLEEEMLRVQRLLLLHSEYFDIL